MKPEEQNWLEKYRDVSALADVSRDVLVGFNANIDVVIDMDNLEASLDEKPEKLTEADSLKDLKSALKYYSERGENAELELGEIAHSFSGEERIGGQAGIMANFLSNIGNSVIFYTPFLSKELAEMINEKVLYPVVDGDFVMKNVRDSANTDRTKRNLIFEYSRQETGRVIFSTTLKGFGPYFRKGVENNFDMIDSDVDRIILSGFHDVEGNIESKLRKSADQLSKLDTPVHMEMVYRNDDISSQIVEYILPEIDSIGMDEDELRKLVELIDLDVETDEITLGHTFQACRKLLERFNMDRCHVHTLDFYMTVTDENYPVTPDSIRDSLLFGGLCGIKNAETGHIPEKNDLENLKMDDKHLSSMKDLHDFQDFFQLEKFAEEGFARVEGYKIAAVPSIIHEDPERLVGMGDIISSGAFVAEISR